MTDKKTDTKKSQTQGYMDIIKNMTKEPKKQPSCWKCASKIDVIKPGDKSFALIGCTEEKRIHNYSDAEKMCPLMKDSPDKILIIINGGVVQLEYKPDNVEIEIRDYDVETSWDEDNVGCKLDEDDDRYQEMIFPATKIKFSANGDNCFTDVEIKEEEDTNKHITILQHDISYFLRETDIEIDETSKEHIEYMIGQGYSEGDLSVYDKDTTYYGYWKIIK